MKMVIGRRSNEHNSAILQAIEVKQTLMNFFFDSLSNDVPHFMGLGEKMQKVPDSLPGAIYRGGGTIPGPRVFFFFFTKHLGLLQTVGLLIQQLSGDNNHGY